MRRVSCRRGGEELLAGAGGGQVASPDEALWPPVACATGCATGYVVLSRLMRRAVSGVIVGISRFPLVGRGLLAGRENPTSLVLVSGLLVSV